MATRVGGKKKYPGTAVITVSLASEDRYSICDYEASFTLATPSVSRRGGGAEDGDDTDVELEDDDFLEYSEVTFDKTAAAAAAVTPVASVTEHVRLGRKHSRQQDQCVQEQDCVKSSQCKSLCALTYHSHRARRRTLLSSLPPPLDLQDQDPASELTQSSVLNTTNNNKQRKLSKYGSEAVVSVKPIEGCWVLVASQNYRDYLRTIGVGRYSVDLVMRAHTLLRLREEPDKQWRVSTETMIKAKSVKGYRTGTRKWTENRFKPAEAKPEVVEDWDPRFVVTTLSCSQEGDRVTMVQVAEKDMAFTRDSVVHMEVDPADPDTMVMTCTAGSVTGWRKFERQLAKPRFTEGVALTGGVTKSNK